jgi:CRP-like cAMP-binding protein
LTHQDCEVENVHLLLSGHARVIIDNAVIADLSPGDFVGEMAYIGSCNASATVVTQGRCRTFRVGIGALRALTGKHEKIEAAMNARFSIDLARKLRTRPLTAASIRAIGSTPDAMRH